MEFIPLISIALEALIATMALTAAFRGRPYLGGLALTFGIYVYYDLARHFAWERSETTLAIAFLVATISAFVSIMSIIRKA